MSNGIRPMKKMSQNQLTQALVELNSRLHGLSMAVSNDMQRLNILMFTLLKDLGWILESDPAICNLGLGLAGRV